MTSYRHKKLENYKNEYHRHQKLGYRDLYTLNCLYFDLEQQEFRLYDIKSAELYIKVDLMEISQTLNSLLGIDKELNKNQNRIIESNFSMHTESSFESAVSNLFIEVNERLVKKINLISLRDEQEEEEELVEETLNYDSMGGNEEDSVFEYANISGLIADELEKTSPLGKPALIRVKLLCKLSGSLSMVNSTRERQQLRRMFSQIDEQLAINVRFGHPISKSPSSVVIRSRRQANRRRSSAKQNQLHNSKNYRDCADLRRAGFTRSNFSCCRETITFSMEQIGWSHWILSPKVIEYKYCRGGCLSRIRPWLFVFQFVFYNSRLFLKAGSSPRFENTQIVYKMFELSHSFESSHCCNIYDYEDDIPFIFGTPPSYQTKMVSLNAKNCLCS